MRVYVAGSINDLATVVPLAEAIADEGHTITFKWWSAEGEIRSGKLRSEDLELLRDAPLEFASGERWHATVRHIPTGQTVTGEGKSKVEAHDAAIRKLKGDLNIGWRSNPEKARQIADTEVEAVMDKADVIVFVYHEDGFGSVLETGGAIFSDKLTYVYRPMRDSVFWYRANVHLVETKAELLDALRAEQDEDIAALKEFAQMEREAS